MKAWIHAKNSAHRHGGVPEDYQVGVGGSPWCVFDSLTEALDEVKVMLENGDHDVRVGYLKDMTREEFEGLPEFNGY